MTTTTTMKKVFTFNLWRMSTARWSQFCFSPALFHIVSATNGNICFGAATEWKKRGEKLEMKNVRESTTEKQVCLRCRRNENIMEKTCKRRCSNAQMNWKMWNVWQKIEEDEASDPHTWAMSSALLNSRKRQHSIDRRRKKKWISDGLKRQTMAKRTKKILLVEI